MLQGAVRVPAILAMHIPGNVKVKNFRSLSLSVCGVHRVGLSDITVKGFMCCVQVWYVWTNNSMHKRECMPYAVGVTCMCMPWCLLWVSGYDKLMYTQVICTHMFIISLVILIFITSVWQNSILVFSWLW